MSSKKILVAEISGKRPGTVKQRPTEKFQWKYDKVIISNNSSGYDTDWPIVNVPDEYIEWYKAHAKTSDNAWYAPMNRSYAIKYAKEHGYDYLVQLDDNIVRIGIEFKTDEGSYRTSNSSPNIEELPNEMVNYMADVLDNTNAGIVGMSVAAAQIPSDDFISERYVYSFFILKLSTTKFWYQGDFEDDIEFRLKLKQQKIPVLCICPFVYNKTAQDGNKDLTGNRAAYSVVGVDRGKHMSKLYGDYYSAGISSRGSGISRKEGQESFRHKLKKFKVQTRLRNWDSLKQSFSVILKKYARHEKDKLVIKTIIPKQSITVVFQDETVRYLVLEQVIKIAIATGATVENMEALNGYALSLKESELENSLSEIIKMNIQKAGLSKEVTLANV